MSRRRSKEGMIEGILSKAREPEATVTVVGQGIDWDSWKELTGALISSKLLTKKNGFYQTTDKGLEWLDLRERMNALVKV